MSIRDIDPSGLYSEYTSSDSKQHTESRQHRVRILEKTLTSTRKQLEEKEKQLQAIRQECRQVTQQLRENQERYKSIFDYGKNAIAIYEAINNGNDFIVRDFNPAAEKIEGIKKQDILGENIKDVFPGIEEMGLLEVFKRVWKNGQAESFPVTQYKDDRIQGWRDNFVFLSATGEVVTVYQDLTTLVQYEDELHLKNKLIELCGEGISIVDATEPDCPVIYVNQSFATMTGYKKHEAIGRNMRFLQGPATDPEVVAKLHKAIRKGREITVEILNYRKNGSSFWNRIAITPLRDNNHTVTHFIAVHSDISREKDTESALRASEEKFRTLTEHSPVGIYLTDADGKCIYVNPKWSQIAGLTPEQASGDGWKEGLYPEDRVEIGNLWRQLVNIQGEWGCEYRFHNAESGIIWVYGHATPFFDSDHNLLGYIGSNVDITKLKESEQSLRKSEERFRAVADYTYDWETWFDSTGKALWINPAVRRITGYDVQDCLAMDNYPLTIVIEEDKEKVADYLTQGFLGKSGSNQSFRIKDKQGTIHWVAISWQSIFDQNKRSLGLRTSIRDIDEQVEAENLLEKERFRLEKSQEIGHIGTWEYDILNNRLIWTKESYRIFGIPEKEELNYETFLECIHPHDRTYVSSEWTEALRGKPYDIEHRIISQGRTKWVRDKAQVVFNQQGKAVLALGVIQDITDEKESEETLRIAQKRFELAMNAVTEGLWDWNVQSGNVYYSPVWSEILDEESVDEKYTSWESRIYPEDKSTILSSLQKHLNGETEQWRQEHRLRTQSGGWKWVLGRGRVILRDDDGTPLRMIGTMKDISQRKTLEQQMTEYQHRLRALNNQMSAIEEQQRRRIAEEVHDHIVQSLVFLDIQMSTLIRRDYQGDIQPSLSEMRTVLAELIETSRNITFNLSNPLLYELGLKAALDEWLDKHIRNKYPIGVTFTMDIPSQDIHSNIREFLFKCTKELTINVVKHAKASRIDIAISSDRHFITLCVGDDGIGFKHDKPGDEMKGFGLFNIHEKIVFLGGTFKIESSDGSGSNVILKIPLITPE